MATALSAAAMAIPKIERTNLVCSVEEQSVEDGKVEIGGIEHEFDAQQHGQSALAGEESVNSGKEHHGRDHKYIFDMYHVKSLKRWE